MWSHCQQFLQWYVCVCVCVGGGATVHLYMGTNLDLCVV